MRRKPIALFAGNIGAVGNWPDDLDRWLLPLPAGFRLAFGPNLASNCGVAKAKRTVTVRVPASTSNLGSGFDTLGLAVRLYNEVSVRLTTDRRLKPAWAMSGEDRAWMEGALAEAAAVFFRAVGWRGFGGEVYLAGNVPMARGLGASATVRVGTLAALNELCGGPLDRFALLGLATELEGHPDNASPAIFGGMTVSGRIGTEVRCLKFPVASRLKLVTLVPRFGISTKAARRLLPSRYGRTDLAHALNRSALITAAFSAGRYESLRGLFDDRVHQPYREALLPQLSKVIAAGERAGALGGFLSGSGSSIICLTLTNARGVGQAMQRVLPEADLCVLSADNTGLKVLDNEI